MCMVYLLLLSFLVCCALIALTSGIGALLEVNRQRADQRTLLRGGCFFHLRGGRSVRGAYLRMSTSADAWSISA